MEKRIGKILVQVERGDISQFNTEAIVNAANSDLWMGAGVAGAIKRRGGEEIEREAMAQGPIRPGEAVLTGGGGLRARYVIHCAGMPPGGRATFDYVRSSVEHAMHLAKEQGIREIAFPAIGAGVGGLTLEQSARAIIEGVRRFAGQSGPIERILLVGYSERDAKILEDTLDRFAGD